MSGSLGRKITGRTPSPGTRSSARQSVAEPSACVGDAQIARICAVAGPSALDRVARAEQRLYACANLMDRPRPVTTLRSPTAPFSKVVPSSRPHRGCPHRIRREHRGVLAAGHFDARSWADAELDSVFEGAFPALITADHVAKKYIGRSVSGPRTEHHPGRGRSRSWCGRSGVPITWNGEVADLPAGCTDTTRRAAEGRERAEEPGTFVICGGIVSPGRTGKAWPASSARPCGLAPGAGCRRVLAPVRPTLRPKTRSRRSARSRAGPGTTAHLGEHGSAIVRSHALPVRGRGSRG
jgi:hypothetical protein